jgi:hypothetical protein
MNRELKVARKGGLFAGSETEDVGERVVKAASPKAETSLERARKRAAELREHTGDLGEGTDEFYVPLDIIPDGWTYEWKRRLLFNKEDPTYAVQLAREGWEPVPVNRDKHHRAMMPSDWQGTTIERHGMMLMERPAEITQDYRNIEARKARNQVKQKEEQLSTTPDGTLSRNDPRVAPRIKKGYEPVPVPEE